jgi:hypothetical protein
MFGRIVLAPYEVVEIEPTLTSPALLPGIIIHHTRADLPQHLLFCAVARPSTLASKIRAAGFREMAPFAEPAGYAVSDADSPPWLRPRISAVVLLVILVLLLLAR